MTKVFFIIGITTFFLFMVQATALFGVSFLINSGSVDFVPPPPPTSILDALTFVVGNFAIFFQLMSLSTGFLILGSVIFLAYGMGMLWAILEMVRGI